MKHKTSQEKSLRLQMIGLLPRMRRFARGLARDPDSADDLVQESCRHALERLDQFKEGSRIDSWLYRIIYTRWIDRLRRAKTRSAHLNLLASERREAVSDTGSMNSVDAAIDVKGALARLPEEHRAAILLIGLEGYSYAEAATVLELPMGTVASRVARARTMLSKILTRNKGRLLRIDPKRKHRQ
jgi:RNA polymerase sigma-70 factor (ECF subfamily)